MRHRILIAVMLLMLCSSHLLARVGAQDLPGRRNRQIRAEHVPGHHIELDGQLTESIWQKAEKGGAFTQRDPEDGAEASHPTRFAVAYDDAYLYVGAWAFDTDPDEIVAILTRRDEYTPSDWIYVSIDSYNDNRTAFEFGLNAAGVKHDLRRYDDTNADWDWDAVWEGAVDINGEGWTAEFQIPFRELRFTAADDILWGFNIYREIPRFDNELSIWNYWSKDESGFVSNYGVLNGLSGMEPHQPWYVQPYIVGSSGFQDDVLQSEGDLQDLLSNDMNIGADIRKNFDNGLTVNATVNPDFGQVEADPAEFNLTQFETYFSEKRPFFLEGGNILNYSLGFGDGDQSSNTLFYSRRIGRSPQAYAQPLGSQQVIRIDQPDWTRIAAATKLTGKLENGTSIGVMSALTSAAEADIHYADGSREQQVIEPFTSYFLSRIQKDYRDGNTTLGGIFTATNRDLPSTDGWLFNDMSGEEDPTGLHFLRREAYTGGLDFNHRFFDRQYEIIASLAFSEVRGSRDAILNTQLNPARYFQRPDADYLEVDSTATRLSGWAGKLVGGKGSGRWRVYGGLLATSPGLEVNDLGYLRTVDNINEFIWVGLREWEPGSWYLSYNLNFNQWANWTWGGDLKAPGGNVNGYVRFKNNWGFGGGIGYNGLGHNTAHLRGGPAIATNRNINLWMNMHTDERKSLSLGWGGNTFYNYDVVSGYNAWTDLTWRPRRNMQFNLGPNYNYFKDSWAWVTQMTSTTGEDRYIFSGLEQHNLSLTLRADVTLTTNLSLQYYTQTYLTGGIYSDYLVVADHRSHDFDQRFTAIEDEAFTYSNEGDFLGLDLDGDGSVEYVADHYVYDDFNYKQFSSNLVLRWEYDTGSTIYLVWSKGASHYINDGSFEPSRDVRTLFDATGDNVLLLKVNTLLNI